MSFPGYGGRVQTGDRVVDATSGRGDLHWVEAQSLLDGVQAKGYVAYLLLVYELWESVVENRQVRLLGDRQLGDYAQKDHGECCRAGLSPDLELLTRGGEERAYP